ncbi:MAG: ribonuclease P protein component [Tistrella sp.]|uniref:Ribonuclease P protein component n=2 Tax=Tistrella mobilis TaxID=171437 RepID=I3TP64_TISMK|nr:MULTISPECIES: ribonuclease P protein component [Tistrella]AFK54552.1 Bacterial ribonuclease P protein [Tistrella mobilis KA081020-065]MAD38933.1 ribonuclease P protein component [Tistrella sp.]MBA76128.1 ribonuclease P protein component [Tistrella sp.]HAE47142.1 ribonuclease P protein component [Tistrella mobilis]
MARPRSFEGRVVKAGAAGLKRRGEFLAAARSGMKWATPGVVVQARPWTAAERDARAAERISVRVGFTASRKVGNSVARNRARRRLRAAVDACIADAMPAHDYVLIARTQTVDRDYDRLLADLAEALRKAPRPRRPRRGGEDGGKVRPAPAAGAVVSAGPAGDGDA